MMKLADMKVDQKKFFHLYVRKALVGWCAQGLANGDGSFDPTIPDDLPIDAHIRKEFAAGVVEHARAKGWVSKTSNTLLVGAYKTAAGMLKVV